MKRQYWIKLWIDMLEEEAVATLPDRLWRRWVELLLIAKLTGRDGILPELNKMAWHVRLPPEQIESELVELARAGLVEQRNGEWIIPKFAERQAPIAMAERKRRSRGWRDGHTAVTAVSQSPPPEDRGTEEQRTEAEDTDADAENFGSVVRTWERAVGPITPMIAEHLGDLADEAESHRGGLPAESAGALADGNTWVIEAIRTAAESASGPVSVAFVRAILGRWLREGFKSPLGGTRGSRREAVPHQLDAWAEGKHGQ